MSAQGDADLIILHAGELLTCDLQPVGDAPGGIAGAGLGIIRDGAVAFAGGRILWVGKSEEVSRRVGGASRARTIDAAGRVVMPGIVECHSHLVFAGTRAWEFQFRAAGRSYEEIAAAGGGIMSTVRATRAASRESLLAAAVEWLDSMLRFGITTLEGKSGYGLTAEDEIRLLEIYREIDRLHPVSVVPTLLAAHTVPLEYRDDPDGYIDLVVNQVIPEVADRGLASFCDVFCDRTAFDVSQSRRVLEAGKRHGLRPKIHADQMSWLGGAELAAELGAVSADHLDHASEAGVGAMARAGVTAVLLPGATFSLGRSTYPPARPLLEAGVRVALSTDFNPGTCYSENPFLMATIASCYMGMTAAEVISSLTYGGACALGMQDEIGSLRAGKKADALMLDTRDHLEIPYHFGVNPVMMVIKNGIVAYERT